MVGSDKTLFYTRLTMHETTMDPQHQAHNGPVALSGVWWLDIVWPSPQSSLILELGFSSPLLHASWMQDLLLNQQRGKMLVYGAKNFMV